jgi:hypothetical protein
MVGRPDDSDLCTTCAGERVHPFDQILMERTVKHRLTPMKGAYDADYDPMPGQGGVEAEEFHERRAAERRKWAGR